MKLSLDKLAQIYGCSVSSIRRLQGEGISLYDPAKVWQHITARRSMPCGTQSKGLAAIAAELAQALGADTKGDIVLEAWLVRLELAHVGFVLCADMFPEVAAKSAPHFDAIKKAIGGLYEALGICPDEPEEGETCASVDTRE